MVGYSTLEFWHGQSHILDGKSVHLQGSVVYIAHGHGQSVDNDGQRIPYAQSKEYEN